MVGSCRHSDLCTFSFHPLKSITTGEGGLVTTNRKYIYDKVKKLSSLGIEKKKIIGNTMFYSQVLILD